MTHAHCVLSMLLPVACYESNHQLVSVSETDIRSRQHPGTCICSASYTFFPLHAAWRLMMAYVSPDNGFASAHLSPFLWSCKTTSAVGTLPCAVPSASSRTALSQAMLYSGMNGVGLALVVPCVQSLIADYTPAENRGAAFGVLYFTGALGVHRPAS